MPDTLWLCLFGSFSSLFFSNFENFPENKDTCTLRLPCRSVVQIPWQQRHHYNKSKQKSWGKNDLKGSDRMKRYERKVLEFGKWLCSHIELSTANGLMRFICLKWIKANAFFPLFHRSTALHFRRRYASNWGEEDSKSVDGISLETFNRCDQWLLSSVVCLSPSFALAWNQIKGQEDGSKCPLYTQKKSKFEQSKWQYLSILIA